MSEQQSIAVTKEQLDDMRHALGWAHTPDVEKLGWRNYYCAFDPEPHLEDLVSKGLMVKRVKPSAIWYRVTPEGARLLGMSEKRIAEVWQVTA